MTEILLKRDPNFGYYPESLLTRVISAFVTPAFETTGIDISKWNGNMNFTTTESRGAKFVYARAGFGTGTRDEWLNDNRIKLSQTNLSWGLYWFCYIGSTSSITAATNFYNIWKENPGKLPPIADLENTTLTSSATTAWVWQFQKTFEELSGVQIGYYTSPGWGNAHLVVSSLYPIWERKLMVAHWTTWLSPILPNVWSSKGKQYTFWQYSADGNGLGVFYGAPPPPNADKDMDLDRYKGTLSEFNAEFNLVELPPEEIKMTQNYYLDSSIWLTPATGTILTGSSSGTPITIPNIPVGAIGVILRVVATSDKIDGAVGFGTGTAVLQQYQYNARVAVPSLTLTSPYVEKTAFVALKSGQVYRQHHAQGGSVKHFVQIVGWIYPTALLPSDTESRISSLESWRIVIDAWKVSISEWQTKVQNFLTSLTNIWKGFS